MQALLKVGLIVGIFLSIDMFYLLQSESDEFEGIPVLKDVVSFVSKLKDSLIAGEKDVRHTSKQSDHHSQETRLSVNKDSANERQVHTQQEQKVEKPVKSKRVEKATKDTSDKHATKE